MNDSYDFIDILQSKYIHRIKYSDNRTILFNRTNGSIFLLSNDELTNLGKNSTNVSNELLSDIENSAILKLNPINKYNQQNSFLVTIELSTNCNLRCTYCYQKSEQKRLEIGDKTLDSIYEYIENVLVSNNSIEFVIIGYIGGEPFLHKDKLVKSLLTIRNITSKYNKKSFFHIDTNGSIDFSDLYNNTNGLEISVSLSSKADHNINRFSPHFDSFEVITTNLMKLKNNSNRLSIRYNTNENNIDLFDEFVAYIKNNIPEVYNIDPMYTDNYHFNEPYFYNQLSLADFKMWNATKAIDILIKYRMPITGTIPTVLQMCSAYQLFSCKVFANGHISLCDSMKLDTNIHIDDVKSNTNHLNKYFSRYKNYNPLNDIKCFNCSKVVQCQGNILCRDLGCLYDKRYDEDSFIKQYVFYNELDLSDFFINM